MKNTSYFKEYYSNELLYKIDVENISHIPRMAQRRFAQSIVEWQTAVLLPQHLDWGRSGNEILLAEKDETMIDFPLFPNFSYFSE